MLLDGAMARLGAGLVRWGGKALAAAVSHEPAHLASRGRREKVASKSRELVTFFSKSATESGPSSTVFAVFSDTPNFLKL